MKKLILSMFLLLTVLTFGESAKGSSKGYNDIVEVEVSVENGKITDIKVVKSFENERIANPTYEELRSNILKKQTTNVDNISGATVTCVAYKEAVDKALNKLKN